MTNIPYVVMLWTSLVLSAVAPNLQSHPRWSNPGFEDRPRDATMPTGWWSCQRGTTPDILPGPWGIQLSPSQGKSYVGLITRADGSFEAIGQRIGILEAGQCYQFSIDLAKAPMYAGHDDAIRLEIYIADSKKKRQQLIYRSERVSNRNWKTHRVEFIPVQSSKYVIIQASADPNTAGHLLMDNLRPIQICDRV